MRFNDVFYEQILRVFPNTTCREISRDCNKSEGYFGSINAQNLELSISALVAYMASLEQKKLALNYGSSISGNKIVQITELQKLIAKEVADRKQREEEVANAKVRAMLVEAISNLQFSEITFDVPPVVI